MSQTSLWSHPGRFPPRPAARSGARPASSCTARTSSPGWTPELLGKDAPGLPMLVTVLLMALAVSVEPFRIGMTVLMLNRPRPALQLLAFLCGGFAMGMTVGLVVLFVFRHALRESSHFTLPKVQILIGLLALAAAAIVVIHGRRKLQPTRLTGPAQRLLKGPSLLVAGIAGLGIALPSVDYLAALAVILASDAAASTQVAVLLMFNVVAFALVEIPL